MVTRIICQRLLSPMVSRLGRTSKSTLSYLIFRRGGVNSNSSSSSTMVVKAAASCPRSYENYHHNSENCEKTLLWKGTLVSLGCLALAYWKGSQLKLIKERWFQAFSFTEVDCHENDHNNSRSKQYNFIAEAVEMAAPSVVYIRNDRVMNTIFGQVMQPSCGSGFIVSDDGYILTNAHVVHQSREVTVKLSSGREVKGVVTFTDQDIDLALIKLKLLKGEKVPSIPFGNSNILRSGEWVIAMGSPLSLANTITAGIVSCVHRPSSEMGMLDTSMEYIQTDAMITKGNSGGPLVNLDGEVIGINSMTAAPGISFAIPSNVAKEFLDRALKKRQQVKKFGIGVSMLTITPEIFQYLQSRNKFPTNINHGVLLAEIWIGSPADHAGLAKGDVIVSINGKMVKSTKDVQMMVQKGQTMEIEIIRNGRKLRTVVLPVAVT